MACPTALWWPALVLVTVLRAWAAAITPLQGTESYYWLWSRHLAAGYYDHPPLLAWAIRGSELLLGKSELAVRLPVLVGGTVATLCVWWLARRMAGARAGARAGLVALCVPYMGFECLVAFPDGVVLGLCALSLCLAWQGRQVAAGWVVGLGGLTKFTAALLGAATLLWELAGGRDGLLRPRRALGWLGASLLAVSPFLAWNAAHDWVTFTFQLGHRQAQEARLVPWRALEFVGLQALTLSPVLCFAMVLAVLRMHREGSVRGRFLAWHAMVPMAPFVLYSLYHKIEPQWPFLACFTAMVAVGVLAEEQEDMRSWWRRGLLVGAPLSALLLAVPLFPSLLFATQSHRLEGASALQPYAFAAVAREAVARAGSRFVVTKDHGYSGAITFYGDICCHWFSQNLHGREFAAWEDYPGLRGRDALFVDEHKPSARAYVRWLLLQAFEEVGEPEPQLFRWQGRPARTFDFWPCRRFRGLAPDPWLRPPPGSAPG